MRLILSTIAGTQWQIIVRASMREGGGDAGGDGGGGDGGGGAIHNATVEATRERSFTYKNNQNWCAHQLATYNGRGEE